MMVAIINLIYKISELEKSVKGLSTESVIAAEVCAVYEQSPTASKPHVMHLWPTDNAALGSNLRVSTSGAAFDS